MNIAESSISQWFCSHHEYGAIKKLVHIHKFNDWYRHLIHYNTHYAFVPKLLHTLISIRSYSNHMRHVVGGRLAPFFISVLFFSLPYLLVVQNFSLVAFMFGNACDALIFFLPNFWNMIFSHRKSLLKYNASNAPFGHVNSATSTAT